MEVTTANSKHGSAVLYESWLLLSVSHCSPLHVLIFTQPKNLILLLRYFSLLLITLRCVWQAELQTQYEGETEGLPVCF